jgi:hypothetical protein
MESVKMKTSVWVKKLHAQLKKAIDSRTAALKKHQQAIDAWKIALDKWLRGNTVQRIARITTTELKDNFDRYDKDRPGFDTTKFFEGAPTPPHYPASLVEPIKRELRRLSIAQPESVYVGDDEIKKFFGEDGEEDDE